MKNIMKNNVYINSFEGSEIYNHSVRKMNVYQNYAGMIPYSLELIKLQSLTYINKEGKNENKFNIHINKLTDKQTSKDIINIKFKQKIKGGTYILENNIKIDKATKKLEELQNELKEINIKINKIKNDNRQVSKRIIKESEELKKRIKMEQSYITYLEDLKDRIEKQKNSDTWTEKTVEDAREYLYNNNFTIKYSNFETGEIENIEYKIYKRSSSKSRTGQCLAIRVDLYNEMIKWSLMDLDIPYTEDTDYAGILSYSSLVGSAIEKTIKINVDNILLVEDVESIWEDNCRVVRTNPDDFEIDKKTGGKIEFLNSFNEPHQIKNSLFDGDSLLQYDYFPEGQGMMLLRQHFFKSAAFATDIERFLRAKCPEGQDFDTWEILNMLGQPILAKNIKMIFTPSSLKAIKGSLNFDKIIGSKKEVWNYWKKLVKNEGNIFGVCKHEKESKRGYDDKGNILQQTSYQQLNSIPFSKNDIDNLVEEEKQYIKKLQNDDEVFIQFLKEEACMANSNNMFVDLYNVNKNIVDAEIFKSMRAQKIFNYKRHIKHGKVRLNSDYCVIIGNPIEYLYHAIGQFDINKIKKDQQPLIENQIYTKLFNNKDELVCFRNPHTSPSNCLFAVNKYVSEIDEYFKFTKNIVAVNAISFAIQDILSSCDYDSDSMLIVKNSTMNKIVKNKVWGQYKVCINDIDCTPNFVTPTLENMCKIDITLATSQKNIGCVVNDAQWAMSLYWNEKSKGKNADKDKLEKLLKIADIGTVLSCVAIDMAKKMYKIDIKKEIQHLEKQLKELVGNEFIKRETKTVIIKGKEIERNEKVYCKPTFFQYVSQSDKIKNKIENYNTSMDYLVKVIDEITPAENTDDTTNTKIPLSNYLITKNMKKADRDQRKQINKLVDDMVIKLNHIYAKFQGKHDKDDLKEKNRMIEDILSEFKKKVARKTVKVDTMYSILKTCGSNVQVRMMNILYNKQTKTFLEAFKQDNKDNKES